MKRRSITVTRQNGCGKEEVASYRKNPTVKEAYKDTLQQYEEKGYIKEVPTESADKGS